MKNFKRIVAIALAVLFVVPMALFNATTVIAEEALDPIVVNGKFNDGTAWAVTDDGGNPVDGAMTIENGKAYFHNGDRAWANLRQTVSVVAGAKYILRFRANIVSGQSEFGALDANNNQLWKQNLPLPEYWPTGSVCDGTTVIEATPMGWADQRIIPNSDTVTLFFKNNNGTCEGWIDDVQLIMVEDAEGNAVTPVYKEEADLFPDGEGGEEPDPEDPEDPADPADPADPSVGSGVVSVNKDFGSAEGWTITDPTVTIANGVVTFTGEQADWKGIQQVVTLKANTNYRVYYKASVAENTRIQMGLDATDWSTRLLEWNIQPWDNGICSDVDGVVFNSGSVTEAYFFANSHGGGPTIGTLDMLVLVEVNENKEPIDAEGNVIEIVDGDEDVVDPGEDPEEPEEPEEPTIGEFTNGDFSTTDAWVISNDGDQVDDSGSRIKIEDGKAVFVNADDGSWIGLKQTFAVEAGATYKISFTTQFSGTGIQIAVSGATFTDSTYGFEGNMPGFLGSVTQEEAQTINGEFLATGDTVTLIFKNREGRCEGWIDDITIEKVVEEEPEPEEPEEPTIGEFTNGDFSTTDAWVISNDGDQVDDSGSRIKIEDGKAVFVNAGDGSWIGLKQTFKLEAGVAYRMTFKTVLSGEGIQLVIVGANVEANLPWGFGATDSADEQNITVDFTPTADEVTLIFKNRQGACAGYIDDVVIEKYVEEEPEEPEVPAASLNTGIYVVKGYKPADAAENAPYALLFTAGIDSLEYAAAGFEVTIGGNTTTYTIDGTVWTALNLTLGGESVRLTPDQYGAGSQYIFYYVLEIDAGELETIGGEDVVVKAFAETFEGEKIYSGAYNYGTVNA